MCVCGPQSAKDKLQHHELIRVATKYPNIAKDYFYNKKTSNSRDYQVEWLGGISTYRGTFRGYC